MAFICSTSTWYIVDYKAVKGLKLVCVLLNLM